MSVGSPQRGKSIIAVVAGFLFVVIASLATDALLHATHIYPPWGQPMSDGLFVLATIYRVIFAAAGSYVAARLAPRNPMKHALVLGVLGTVAAIAGLIGAWNKGPELGPRWYPIALVVTALPSAWVGGKLYREKPSSNAKLAAAS